MVREHKIHEFHLPSEKHDSNRNANRKKFCEFYFHNKLLTIDKVLKVVLEISQGEVLTGYQ